MKFAVIGGDTRFVRLARLIRKAGHTADCCLLEGAAPCTAVETALKNADCAILPLPCVRGDALNAPFAAQNRSIDEILSRVEPGTTVFAGQAEKIAEKCALCGLKLIDYSTQEGFAVKNAVLTAEAAVSIMLEKSRCALWHENIVICGFGRIGRMLALRLASFEPNIYVLAHSSGDLAWAEALGCHAIPLGQELPKLSYGFVVNTVPAQIISDRYLRQFGDAALIELASAPYGFDFDRAKALGKAVELEASLPGRYAPEAAARIIYETIIGFTEV